MKLEAFYPHVLPEVPGCPDPLVNSRLIAAAAEFCRETLSWNEVQDPIVLADGVSDYELETPTGAYVESVLSVTIGSRKLIPAAEGFVGTSTSVEPVYYNTSDYGVLRVYPTPQSPVSSMLVTVAYTPSIDATSLPDFMKRFVDTISAGAKAQLLMMTAWVNPQMASYYRAQFMDGINRARIQDAHGGVVGPLRVKPRAFGF